MKLLLISTFYYALGLVDCKFSEQVPQPRTRIGSQHSVKESPGSVLIILPCMSGSHEFLLDQISYRLLSQGYNITKVRLQKTDDPDILKNAEHIEDYENLRVTYASQTRTNGVLRTLHLKFNTSLCNHRLVTKDGLFHMDKSILWNTPRYLWNIPLDSFQFGDCLCHMLLSNKKLTSLLEDSSFTLSIIDVVGNDCGYALCHHLGIPVVGFTGGSANNGQIHIINGYISPAVSPNMMTEIVDLRVFTDRLWNVFISFMDKTATKYLIDRSHSIIQVCIRTPLSLLNKL